MRSRIAVTLMLVLGLVISGAGAGLAVSGLSGGGSAGVSQYKPEDTTAQGVEDVGGQEDQDVTDEDVQAARQVEVTGGDDELAFTGFAAIPLLLAGVGLLGAGFMLRRGSTQKD